jgi:hypothetical protein
MNYTIKNPAAIYATGRWWLVVVSVDRSICRGRCDHCNGVIDENAISATVTPTETYPAGAEHACTGLIEVPVTIVISIQQRKPSSRPLIIRLLKANKKAPIENLHGTFLRVVAIL